MIHESCSEIKARGWIWKDDSGALGNTSGAGIKRVRVGVKRTIHRSGLTEGPIRPSERSQSGPHSKRIRIHEIPEHLEKPIVASS